ncbi:MAG: ATP-binding protein [Pseudomonadales bacterium]|nr:ATP-binding protein [Pseudomonadales bacterium]
MDEAYRDAYQRERKARLRAEELLEKLASEIYSKNRELADANETLRKNQATLVQNEKMASVGFLASGIAHEINNPLGFSLSNLYVLLEYAADLIRINSALRAEPGLNEACRKILDDPQLVFMLEDIPALTRESIAGLESVKQIVSYLRGFARTDKDETALHNINDSIQTTLNVLRNELKYKCQLHTTLADLPLIPLNAGRLSQVFANLVINALQAMPEPGGLYITTRVSTDGQWVNIEIDDDGPGVPAAIANDIFNPFFTTKTVGEGTGLGLSICHAIIVEELGGQLRLQEEGQGKGKGASFLVSLPLHATPQQH